MSWYKTGYDSLKNDDRTVKRPDHFWIREGESRDIMFLDDEPIEIGEHNPFHNGSWKNHETCLAGVYDDVACCSLFGFESKRRVFYYTVMEMSPITSQKTGKTYQYALKLLQAKTKTAKMLKLKKDKRGGSLIGAVFTATRHSEKDPSCGSEFEFVRTVENIDSLINEANYYGKKLTEWYTQAAASSDKLNFMKKVFQLAFDPSGKLITSKLVPFNYFEILKPKAPTDIRSIYSGYRKPSDEKEEVTTAPAVDESVPF